MSVQPARFGDLLTISFSRIYLVRYMFIHFRFQHDLRLLIRSIDSFFLGSGRFRNLDRATFMY